MPGSSEVQQSPQNNVVQAIIDKFQHEIGALTGQLIVKDVQMAAQEQALAASEGRVKELEAQLANRAERRAKAKRT